MVFKDLRFGPIGVLQEGDVMGACLLEDPNLAGTLTRCNVVPTSSRIVFSPVGPPPASVCSMAMGLVSLHL